MTYSQAADALLSANKERIRALQAEEAKAVEAVEAARKIFDANNNSNEKNNGSSSSKMKIQFWRPSALFRRWKQRREEKKKEKKIDNEISMVREDYERRIQAEWDSYERRKRGLEGLKAVGGGY